MVSIDPVSTWGGKATFSDVTLAWMDDTGWYVSNKERQGKHLWGHQAGCDFLTTCTQYYSNSPGQTEYCPAVSTGVCSPDPSYTGGNCKDFGYFNNACKTSNRFYWSGTPLVPNQCTSSTEDHLADDKLRFGWSAGATSRCISTSPEFKTADGAGYSSWLGVACYPMSCDSGSLKVGACSMCASVFLTAS